MYKYKITIEYDGTSYHGWQTQKNAKSIQGVILNAAEKLFGAKVDIQGAGRTDAGVHAIAQVAHIETPRKLSIYKIEEGLNDLLPSNINITKVETVPTNFHARHHAKLRSYIYVISKRRTAFGKRYVWWVKDKLDIKKMIVACNILRGFHDFASFSDKRLEKGSSTKVKLDRVDVFEVGNTIFFRFIGSHFLWKMVRRMVGIIVEVGKGNITSEAVSKMLKEHSDLPAKHTAPPSGLFLEYVLYDDDEKSLVDVGEIFPLWFSHLLKLNKK